MKPIKQIAAGLVLLIMFTLCACSNINTDSLPAEDRAVSFTENKRSRSEECVRTYTEYLAKTDHADISIEKALYNEADAMAVASDIENTLIAISDYFAMELERPTIMLVTQDNYYGRPLKQSFSQRLTLFTNVENVNSHEYAAPLIGMLTGVRDAWAQYGIAAQICSAVPDAGELKQYYNSGGDINILSLAPSRLFEPLAGDKTEAAQKTAVCFYDFLVKSYGKEAALELALGGFEDFDISAQKKKWLESIGVSVPYEYEYENAFAGYKFERSLTHDVMISAPCATYLVNLSDNDDTLLMNTCEGFEHFLYINKMGIQAYWELVDKSELSSKLVSIPPIYDIIEETVQLPSDDIAGYITDMTVTPPYIRLHERRIEYAHMHEYVHATLPFCPNVVDKRAHTWLGEGLACALSTALPLEYAHEISIAGGVDELYDYIAYDLSTCTDETFKLFLSVAQEHYFSKINEGLSYDRKCFVDALAVGMLRAYPNAKDEGHPYLFESWMSYMIEMYSLDNALAAYLDTDSFESIYGMTFEASLAQWAEHFN